MAFSTIDAQTHQIGDCQLHFAPMMTFRRKAQTSIRACDIVHTLSTQTRQSCSHKSSPTHQLWVWIYWQALSLSATAKAKDRVVSFKRLVILPIVVMVMSAKQHGSDLRSCIGSELGMASDSGSNRQTHCRLSLICYWVSFMTKPAIVSKFAVAGYPCF